MTLWHFIIFAACALLVLVLVYRCGGRLLRKVDDCIKAFIEGRKLLLVCALALSAVAAGPRIENWNAWTEPNGCKFATFTLSDEGERGNYYLTCNSPEFPQFYLPADFWAPVTRIEYVGAASFRVALYTNFSCAVFRLEKIQ